jgi:hypothetical protein
MADTNSKDSEATRRFTVAVFALAAGPFGAFVFGRRLKECISTQVYQGVSKVGRPFYYSRADDPSNFYVGVGVNSTMLILSAAAIFFGISRLLKSLD